MSLFGRAPRVLTYSHDGYGLGHLRRNLRLISGLVAQRSDVSALAVTGCRFAHAFHFPTGVDYLRLPAVTKVANDHYVADGLSLSSEEVTSLRARLICAAVEQFDPDLVLVDRHPLGLKNELEQALRAWRVRRPAGRLVLGLRDIIDAPEVVRAEWREKRHAETIEELFDAVLVYGSRAVYDPIAEYDLPAPVAARVRFTGYVAETPAVQGLQPVLRADDQRAGNRLALCTLGGGKDAFPVAAAFLSAMRRLSGDGWTGLLVAGPYMSEAEWHSLNAAASGGPTVVRRFVTDMPSHLASADAVLCMGGYNTLCEALSVGAAAVVVPRVHPRVEQWIRANAFAARGLVQVIHPDDLQAERVADELRIAGRVDRHARRRAFEDFGRHGLARAVEHLRGQLGAAHDASARQQPVAELVVSR